MQKHQVTPDLSGNTHLATFDNVSGENYTISTCQVQNDALSVLSPGDCFVFASCPEGVTCSIDECDSPEEGCYFVSQNDDCPVNACTAEGRVLASSSSTQNRKLSGGGSNISYIMGTLPNSSVDLNNMPQMNLSLS